MKKFLLLCTIYGLFCFQARAKTDLTFPMEVCRNLEVILWSDFTSKNIALPDSWDEIPTIREMKMKLKDQNLATLRGFNELILIPGTPLIQPATGISRAHSNKKLIAISRSPTNKSPNSSETNAAKELGRYGVIISPDHSTIAPIWIAENEATLILSQIPRFIASEQPKAFENIEVLEHERKMDRIEASLELEKQTRSKKKFKKSDETSEKIGMDWVTSPLSLMLAFFLIVLLVFVYRKSHSTPTNS